MLPRPAVDQIVRALRTYHHQVGSFPQCFVELEARVWRYNHPPNFGDDGRSPSMANYYYLYYAVDSGACTLWAIPINKRREEASTFFLALSLPKQSAAGRERPSHSMRSSDCLVFPNLHNSRCSDSPSNNRHNYNRQEMAARLPLGIDNANKNQRNQPPLHWWAHQRATQACGPPRSQSAFKRN
jgi:hypothetical protein